MKIRTTRQAREIRFGINLARDLAITSRNGEFLYQYPLMHRAYIRTRNLPPAGVDEQLRVDHPERHASNESGWKVGDEIVTVTNEAGTIVMNKAYADRMGVQGKPGRITE